MVSRKCVVTGKILPTDQLIRFVLINKEKVVLEKNEKILGRGAYCLKEEKVIDELFKRRILNKSFKRNILPEVYNSLRKDVDEYVKEK